MTTTRGSAGTDAAAGRRWRLDHDGHRLQVETERVGWMRIVRLYVDGVQHAQTEALHQARIPYRDRSVLVAFDPLGLLDGQAARCVLTPPRPADGTGHETEQGADDGTGNDAQDGSDDDTDDDTDDDRGGGTDEGDTNLPFTPPEGSRAARRERFARRHPALYASRHVAAATAKVVFGILGVSALIGAVVRLLLSYLPRPDVDLPDVDLPDLPLPDIPRPDIQLPDVTLPPWLQAVVATSKYWMPILIAIGVAVHEVDRRKKNDRRHEAQQGDAHPGGKQS
ncbi:hypothetical protein Arub01_58370 [Actinomadura rubrobrunea]|uniref:Uncharacterized protein n=1 Tax=Actinomadura rubrobrunea TaxID=115335 RepID=A0A9W6UXQ6_9ACTN|nr:hypothetical protein [Actinomadura rubrobrunea]GLW67594.1 hypothetical protein Arub01_58370 [Actinomadura rubrobrunea]